MRLRKAILTASMIGFAGWANAHSEAGELFGGETQCDEYCDPINQPRRASKLWNYDYWHNKTMPKRKIRQHAVHQWQRWFLNPVVTPDQTCNYGYFETQWRQAPFQTFQACPPVQVQDDHQEIPTDSEFQTSAPASSIPTTPPPVEPLPEIPSPRIPVELPEMPPVEPFPAPEMTQAPAKPSARRDGGLKPASLMSLEDILAEKNSSDEAVEVKELQLEIIEPEVPKFEVLETSSLRVATADIPKFEIIEREIPKLEINQRPVSGFKTLERTESIAPVSATEQDDDDDDNKRLVKVVESGFVQLEDRTPTIVLPRDVAQSTNVQSTEDTAAKEDTAVAQPQELPPLPGLVRLPEEMPVPEVWQQVESLPAVEPLPLKQDLLPGFETLPQSVQTTSPLDKSGRASVGSTVREVRFQFLRPPAKRPDMSVRRMPRIGPFFD